MTLKFVLCITIFLYSVYITKAQFSYFDSLGADINRQVQEQVRKINENVNEEIRRTNENVRHQVASINHNVDSQVSDVNKNINNLNLELATLGPRINEAVQKSLEPLEAFKIQSKMARGIGGITIATYGDTITVILRNGKKYGCPGNILQYDSTKPPFCTKQLSTNLSLQQTICTANSYSRVNNIFCFGINAGIQCINDSCQCINGGRYTLEDLQNLCGRSYGSNTYAEFVYYPDITDNKHIQIPNPNKHVTCVESNSNVNVECTWYGNGYIIDN